MTEPPFSRLLRREMASLSGIWTLISNIFATSSYAVLVLADVSFAVFCGVLPLGMSSSRPGTSIA